MSEVGIKNQIYQYERKISEKKRLVHEQEEKIYNLQMLRSKILTLEDDFIERQYVRQKTLENMLCNSINNRIARLYKEGMQNLLGGSEYRSALANFQKSCDQTEMEIKCANDKIEQLNRDIQYYRNKIQNFQRELAALGTQ